LSNKTGLLFFLINATEVFIIHSMNSKQMKKWLEQQGATFQVGKGSHLKVFLNGRQSALPMHGVAELGKGLEAAIKRQLGLK
jgi:mRNA interferase HicA